jgi:hypothetical protein
LKLSLHISHFVTFSSGIHLAWLQPSGWIGTFGWWRFEDDDDDAGEGDDEGSIEDEDTGLGDVGSDVTVCCGLAGESTPTAVWAVDGAADADDAGDDTEAAFAPVGSITTGEGEEEGNAAAAVAVLSTVDVEVAEGDDTTGNAEVGFGIAAAGASICGNTW